MDAVLTAGGIPQPQDPLYTYSNGESKALIDVAGKPMVQWVLDALGEAKTVDRVVLVGLTKNAGLTCKKPLHFVSGQGRLLENIKAGTAKVMELNRGAKHILFVTSDIPAINGQMVDWVVHTCLETEHDLYYNVVRRESMEQRFPASMRTFTRLKDMEVCGGDMNVARAAIVGENSEFWDKVFEARKNPAAQAALIGWDIIFKFIFRQLTIDDVIQRVADKLGIRGRAIVSMYPEIGMDVDKPHQLEIMRTYLGRRVRAQKRRRPTAKKTAVRRAKRTATKKSARRKPAKTTVRAKKSRRPATRPGRGRPRSNKK
jgi:GTP:adenosylcobinamide-phosphate guanylyltransferase